MVLGLDVTTGSTLKFDTTSLFTRLNYSPRFLPLVPVTDFGVTKLLP